MGRASDGCRPKLHRWPFSLLHLVPRSTSLAPHRPCDSIGNKKNTCKRVLQEERVCRCLHDVSVLTPCVRIVAIVCAVCACTPVKQLVRSMIRQPRAERKTFYGSRGPERFYFLCTSDSSASNPWKTKAAQGVQGHPEARQRRSAPCPPLTRVPACGAGVRTRMSRQDATPGTSCLAGHAWTLRAFGYGWRCQRWTRHRGHGAILYATSCHRGRSEGREAHGRPPYKNNDAHGWRVSQPSPKAGVTFPQRRLLYAQSSDHWYHWARR